MSSQNWRFLTPSPPLSRLFTLSNRQFLTPSPLLRRLSLWMAPLLAKEDLRMTKFLQLHKCISLINLYWRSLKGYRWNWNSLTKRQTTFNKHWNFATLSQREKVEYITYLVAWKAERDKMFFLGHPKIWADQLTLFSIQSWVGQIMPTTLLVALPDFQTFLRPCV